MITAIYVKESVGLAVMIRVDSALYRIDSSQFKPKKKKNVFELLFFMLNEENKRARIFINFISCPLYSCIVPCLKRKGVATVHTSSYKVDGPQLKVVARVAEALSSCL